MALNDDTMLYASYSKGFKAGGWTTRLSVPIPNIDDAAFGPEESASYELGLKSRFFDDHVQANLAVFWTDYTGIQLQIQEGASPVSQNAGDAELKGAELEVEAIIGGGFSVNVAAGFIDAQYTKLRPRCRASRSTPTCRRRRTPSSRSVRSGTSNLANSGKIRFNVDYT